MNEPLRNELLAMAAEDGRVRGELIAEGALGDGYHPRMREVHEKNAKHLIEIIEGHGWPGRSLVGEDGAEAAWRIAQHAIGNPALQRRAATLLEKATTQGEMPAWQVAYLVDRIRMFEGKPQLYGSQFDWDESGELNPCPIENPEQVNERRRSVDLGTIEERIRQMREGAARSGETPPKDREKRQRKYEGWLREVGWRD